MNKLKQFFCIAILIVIYVYVCNITLLPNSVIIFEGEELNLKTVVGLKIKRANGTNMPVIQASNLGESEQSSKYETAGTFELNLNLFGTIPVKEIDVNVIPKTKVVPMGNLIGAKLYTSGVLVVGMSEIQGDDQQKHKPYEGSGIEEGDMIVEMDSKKIANTDELVETVNSSKGKVIQIKYVRNDETITTSIQPIKSEDNEYKLGLWVRDAAAGVGTLTFYEPSTGKFAALGHGIVDVDTGDIINIANGELVTSNLVAIKKGEKGTPGEIKGSIDSGVTIGNISKNTNFGVFGLVSNKNNLNLNGAKEYEVALRSEIQTGEAEIICELENEKKEQYKIEISKIYTSNNYDNKSMMIKITDERLLQKTGGIIQGMSGSPIVQNGKLVGAVTHVFLNDPTKGYGVFIENMIEDMDKIDEK